MWSCLPGLTPPTSSSTYTERWVTHVHVHVTCSIHTYVRVLIVYRCKNVCKIVELMDIQREIIVSVLPYHNSNVVEWLINSLGPRATIVVIYASGKYDVCIRLPRSTKVWRP